MSRNRNTQEGELHEFAVGNGWDILVVDDNDTSLIAIEAALEPLGRRLVIAHSGVEALARLLEQDFALILLDVAMPGMDGFEVARLVRSRERNRATPIIFITGLSWQDDLVSRSNELGAFDFMTKPIRAELLRAKARVFVELQQRTLQLREAQLRAHERELDEQRRRYEAQAMERQMQQLAEADRRKDEFLAILAHELRNPLQPMQTAVELIRHQMHGPDHLVGIVDRQLHHLTRLVDDLLDVARFTSQKLELRRRPVALHTIVEESVTSCHGALEARKHQLAVRAAPRPVMIDGDPTRLVQVLCNLLHNAAKYTDPGGHIEIKWGAETGQGYVRVTDDGRGIAPDVLPKIFDMFVSERVSIDGYGGLGLGLGLVKRLVELHGGSVTGTSDGPGQGSAFEVRLPLADETSIDVSTTRASRRAETLDARPLKLVVCDDQPDARQVVAELLRSRGHDVTVVADGVAAVRAILDQRPNAALVDIGLPGMNGYEVARTIRRELSDERPRLIAMTGYGQASDRASALDAGFDAHITKPATSEKILGALWD